MPKIQKSDTTSGHIVLLHDEERTQIATVLQLGWYLVASAGRFIKKGKIDNLKSIKTYSANIFSDCCEILDSAFGGDGDEE